MQLKSITSTYIYLHVYLQHQRQQKLYKSKKNMNKASCKWPRVLRSNRTSPALRVSQASPNQTSTVIAYSTRHGKKQSGLFLLTARVQLECAIKS